MSFHESSLLSAGTGRSISQAACRPEAQFKEVTGDLFNNDYGGVVDGLHDSSQATAQVVGLVDMDFGWVF